MKKIKSKKRVVVYFHTHWDREWYKTRVEFNFRLVKVFDDVLKKLQNKTLPCFYFDGQASALVDYLKFRPEKENLIKKFIKDKRLFIGPFYCSADSFLVSIQSMMANLDMGIDISEKYGCNEFIGYCADTFGHAKSLPYIFNYYNLSGGIFWRGLGELPQCFDWNGLKSVYLRQGYFHDCLNNDFSYQKKAELIEKQLLKIDDNTQDIILLPLGADHLKVADNIKRQIGEINKYLKNYQLEISNPIEYLKSVKPTKKVKTELRDNARNFILPGVLSSRTDLKIKNSYSQWNLLRIAEPLNALCINKGLIKNNYQPLIDSAKEELIKNHAHDSIYGCSVDEVHKAMERRFQIVNETSKTAIREIINELSEESKNIRIVNLSDYKYSGLCKIKTDKELNNAQLIKKEFSIDEKLSLDPNMLPVTSDYKNIYTYLIKAENLKPFSVSKVKLKPVKTDLKISKDSIENSKIALKIKNDKIEITDKTNNKIYSNFIEFLDMADVGDSYNFAPLKRNKKYKSKIINSKIYVEGNLRAVLQIDVMVKIPWSSSLRGRSKSIVNQNITLFAILDTESDFIRFKTKFTNRAKDHILKVTFNLKEPVTKTISDDLLGTVERKFDPEYDMSRLMPAKKGVEVKTNTAPLQTFVESQGVAVITKGLNEYEVRKNAIEITLLRSTGIISNPKNPARGTPAGPPISTLDSLLMTENCHEFALIFNNNEDKIKAAQQAFYGSVFAIFSNVKEQRLLKIKGKLISAKYRKALKIRTFARNKIFDL